MADILVVDDEPVVSQSISRISSSVGLTVAIAGDGTTGLQKIRAQEYRLIVCDIMLPDLDGFQFLSALEKADCKTPVIITTGYTTAENAVRALQSGAIDYIPKPFTEDEFLGAVHRGFQYIRIQKSLAGQDRDDGSIIFVPCPAKYFRLGYSTWALLEHSGSVVIGVTDLFLKSIETIREINILDMDEVMQGRAFAQFGGRDGLTHPALAPLGGKLIEKNRDMMDNPGIVEKDPYFKGWLVRIFPSSLEYELSLLNSCSSDRV